MSVAFTNYEEALADASAKYKRLKGSVDYGIEKTTEYGEQVFVVKMLPKPENCYGHELRMERVNY